MKFAATTLALVLAMTGACAFAADPAPAAPAKALTPQQQKMKDCNAQAGDKKGDERKAFMSTCLKSDSTATAAAPAKPMTQQQQKMKSCSVQAKEQHLAGDERKTFMSSCLKNSKTAPAAPPAAAPAH
jgi:hypothetical protein